MNPSPAPATAPVEKFYTAQELALALGLHVRTVQRWLQDGRFPNAFLIGGPAGYRIPASDVREFSAQLAARRLVSDAASQK